MEKLSNNREMVRKLSRVEDIFKTYERLNERLEDASAELERAVNNKNMCSSLSDSKKVTHFFTVYVIAFILCSIIAFIGYKIGHNTFAGTYVSMNDESYVLTVNRNKTFELESPKYNLEGTWQTRKGFPYTLYLEPENFDYFTSGQVNRFPDDDPWFSFSGADDSFGTPSVYTHPGAISTKLLIIIAIIVVLSIVIERRMVKSHNRDIDSYKERVKGAGINISLCKDRLYAIESDINSIAAEYRRDFADWYPPKYSYPEAAAYFRELFENNRVSNMREAMDKFEEYLYRNEMLRMQYKQKELMTKQMALQRDTFNSVNENFAKLSDQIAADGAMTRAAVIAEGESIKHRVSKEANNINNNMAAESARINKNIKKYSPFS